MSRAATASISATATLEEFRRQERQRCTPQQIQHMARNELFALQRRLGLGFEWGVIEFPKHWMPPGQQRTRTARRRDICKEIEGEELPCADLELAQLLATRFVLVLFLVPMHGRRGTFLAAPASLCGFLRRLCRILKVVARKPAVNRERLFDRLEPADLLACGRRADVEAGRIVRMAQQGLWSDIPLAKPAVDFEQSRASDDEVTDERDASRPYLPLPDELVGEAGWRIAWLTEKLGPSLIRCAIQLARLARGDEHFIGSRKQNWSSERTEAIKRFLASWVWIDPEGRSLDTTPFELLIKGFGGNAKRPFRWPARTGAEFMELLKLLQTAHLFIFLLSTGGRISEALSLKPGCIRLSADGLATAEGRTFKLVFNDEGRERDWPLPALCVTAIRQQQELAQAITDIGLLHDAAHSSKGVTLESIWVRVGTAGVSFTNDYNEKLTNMLRMLGLSHLLGGGNIHAHRFRKTIARLIALAIVGAPKILMDLFGHASIEMTLTYILSDPGIRAEMMEVAKAQTIMLAETAIHAADANGGPAASRIVAAVATERIRRGEEYGEKDVRSLAETLTLGGRYWELVRPGVVCTKYPQQPGACTRKVGIPDPAKCKSSCTHRLEEAAFRDDVDRTLALAVDYLESAEASEDVIAAEMWRGQILANLYRFDDIAAKWRAHPTVAALSASQEITK